MKKKISYKNNENEWNIKIRQNNRIKGTYREKRERERKSSKSQGKRLRVKS